MMSETMPKRLRDALVGFLEDMAYWYGPVVSVMWVILRQFDGLMLSLIPSNCQMSRVAVVYASVFVWVWVLQAFYYWLSTQEWALKYKITLGNQAEYLASNYSLPDQKQWRETLKFKNILINSLKNQAIYFGLGVAMHSLPQQFSSVQTPGWDQAAFSPSLTRVILELAFSLVLFDLLLGIAHYLLHTVFYKYHKDHHQTKGDSPLSGWYMTTLDLMMELWIPIFVPAFVIGMSWQGFWIWLLLVEWDGVHSHAAFDFGSPMPSPKRHWLHHIVVHCNYSNGIFDAIMNTEAKMRSVPVQQPPLPTLLSRKRLQAQDEIKKSQFVFKDEQTMHN